ncbi:MAG: glycosyltransferase family 39 protein [bacterium]|nr:glycosyltransferase family 39 protein [bacterium]
MKKTKKYILLALIISFGFFLRVYNIENAPPGIYPDEAVNGEDALRANATGNYQWFYPANQGREGLFMNLIAFSFKFFGASIFTLKLPSIIFGTLTILGIYLLAKELFKSERIGLISAFLTAVSFWAINFSRIAFRANMLPTILVFSFYFLFRGLRTKKWWDFAIGGFIFGIGMHSYIAWRIAPVVLVIMLLFFALARKNFFKDYWKSILIFLFFSIISAFPMFLTFYQHPEFFESRSSSISVLSPEVNQGNPIRTFLRSFALSMVKYNFWGDQNWRHNFPPYPLLDPLTGLAFLLGFIISIKVFFQTLVSRIRKKSFDTNLEKHAFLLLWFFLLLAPEFMTAEGNPHALRAIGTLPAVFILSALGFDNIFKKSEKEGAFWKKFTLSMLISVFLVIGLFNSLKYHIFWAENFRVAESFNKNVTDISNYVYTLPKTQEKYIITSYNTLIKLPIYIFHSDDSNVGYFYPNELEKIQPKNPHNSIFIFIEKNDEAIAQIQKQYPFLKLTEKNYPLQSKFYILQ